MTMSDQDFAGSVPAIYDRVLGPLLFRPYAVDLADRVAALAPSRVLETAAGTGIATEQLVRALRQEAAITATDLKQPMLNVASSKHAAPNVTWQACDAMQLPFQDAEFDVVVCQFGVMFFPDKLVAYREARRVLRPGGTFLFNVWDSLSENALPRVVADAVRAAFPSDPPDFFARIPHGYCDIDAIKGSLGEAGFSRITAEKLQLRSKSASSHDAAIGFCQGTPLRTEIESRDVDGLAAVSEAAAVAVSARFGATIDVPMQAIVFSATR
jgi:SAM-dependent methyltransferase